MYTPIKICKWGTQPSTYYILLVLLIIQILIGGFLIITCESIKFSLLRYFHEIQKNELNIRMYLIEFYSVHLIIFYMCGIVFARHSLNEAYTEHLKILLKFWNTLICLLSIEGLITAWLCHDSFESVSQSIEISLYRGIDAYYESSNWRLIWDNLQYYNQCCGVKDYHDWEAITWMEYELTKKRDSALTNLKYVSLTPYSCCKIASSCYENLFVENDSDERNKRMQLHQLLNTNLTVINKEGCLSSLIDRMSTVLDVTVHLAILVFLIQIIISILMALIYVTNRTYLGDGCDIESSGSDYDDQIMVSRMIAQTAELRKQFCGGEHSDDPETHHRRSRISHAHHPRRSSSHDPHHSRHHGGHHGSHHGSHEHIDGYTCRHCSSYHDRHSQHVDDEFRQSVIEPAEEFRRSILSYEKRHSLHPSEERSSLHANDEHRRSSLHANDEHRRSSLHADDEHRRSSLHADDEHRRSSLHPEEEHRRSSLHPDEEHRRSSYADGESRRSTLHADGESRRSSAGYLQRNSEEDFRHSVLEPAEQFRKSVLSYGQRHSGRNSESQSRHLSLSNSLDHHRSTIAEPETEHHHEKEHRHVVDE